MSKYSDEIAEEEFEEMKKKMWNDYLQEYKTKETEEEKRELLFRFMKKSFAIGNSFYHSKVGR